MQKTDVSVHFHNESNKHFSAPRDLFSLVGDRGRTLAFPFSELSYAWWCRCPFQLNREIVGRSSPNEINWTIYNIFIASHRQIENGSASAKLQNDCHQVECRGKTGAISNIEDEVIYDYAIIAEHMSITTAYTSLVGRSSEKCASQT